MEDPRGIEILGFGIKLAEFCSSSVGIQNFICLQQENTNFPLSDSLAANKRCPSTVVDTRRPLHPAFQPRSQLAPRAGPIWAGGKEQDEEKTDGLLQKELYLR